MITGWRYYWRRYLGWFPVQFCMVCGKPYWGGLPKFEWQLCENLDRGPMMKRRLICVWMPWWMDYCSQKCADEEIETLK